MKRYIIRENIPWEGYNQWTVFAISRENAKFLVSIDNTYTGETLDIISEKSAKGRKDEGIHKKTTKFEE